MNGNLKFHIIVFRSNPSPPPTPREPTPPPKPDSTECHRSQSAIFTRNWNRGEGNSCARTDLFFKPVPDSKLARKREERLRKATVEREQDAMKAAISAAQANDAKMARLEMAGHPHHPPPQQHGPPHNMFGDPFAQHAAALAGLGFPGSQMERMERERREQVCIAIKAMKSVCYRLYIMNVSFFYNWQSITRFTSVSYALIFGQIVTFFYSKKLRFTTFQWYRSQCPIW